MPYWRAQCSSRCSIFISTGGINKQFEIIDAVMVMDSQKAGLLSGPELEKAFDGVKERLREKCHSLGGDGIIFCQFEHRSAHSGGLMSSLVIEFFAYGTVVRVRADAA